MASEAHRIMNLSLTKIVSSRGRRGGPSLHRNLLLASVLFRARDLYAAEMAGLVVFRNGYVYDRNSLPVDTPDPIDAATADDDDTDNSIPDHRIQESVVAVLNPVSSRDPSPSNGSDESCDVDMEKENVRPKDFNNSATTATDSSTATPVRQSKRNRKSPSRKRKFTETEQAVLSIAEPTTDSPVSAKKVRGEKHAISLDCSELSTTLTDRCVDQQTSTASEAPQISRVTSTINHNANSAVAYSSHAFDDYDDDDDDDDESKYNDISSYQCHVNSAASDSISSLLLSHPVLVVGV